MNSKWTTCRDLDPAVEEFAAQLVEVAYRVVLRNTPVENWLDLRLELWRVVKELVGEWAQRRPTADGPSGS